MEDGRKGKGGNIRGKGKERTGRMVEKGGDVGGGRMERGRKSVGGKSGEWG